MAYNNDYNNTFSMANYFADNYGMPARPKKPVLAQAWTKRGCLITLLLIWVWIPMAIIITVKNKKEQAAYDAACAAWNDALNYRKANWPAEYDKALATVEEGLQLKESGMKKLNLEDDQLAKAVDKDTGKTIEPFYISGNLLKDGFWRSYTDGTYRCSMKQYTHLFFTEDQVMIYIRKVDLLNPSSKKESTLEFFYSDITSVSVSQDSIETKTNLDAKSKDSAEEIDVERFQLVVPGDKMYFAYTATDESTANINNLRQRIRQAKVK